MNTARWRLPVVAVIGVAVLALAAVGGAQMSEAVQPEEGGAAVRVELTSGGTVRAMTSERGRRVGIEFVNPAAGRLAGMDDEAALRRAVQDYIVMARAYGASGLGGGQASARVTFRSGMEIGEFNSLMAASGVRVQDAYLITRYANGQNGGVGAPGTDRGLDEEKVRQMAGQGRTKDGSSAGGVTSIQVVDATVLVDEARYARLTADPRVLVVDASQGLVTQRIAAQGFDRERQNVMLPRIGDIAWRLGLGSF